MEVERVVDKIREVPVPQPVERLVTREIPYPVQKASLPQSLLWPRWSAHLSWKWSREAEWSREAVRSPQPTEFGDVHPVFRSMTLSPILKLSHCHATSYAHPIHADHREAC